MHIGCFAPSSLIPVAWSMGSGITTFLAAVALTWRHRRPRNLDKWEEFFIITKTDFASCLIVFSSGSVFFYQYRLSFIKTCIKRWSTCFCIADNKGSNINEILLCFMLLNILITIGSIRKTRFFGLIVSIGIIFIIFFLPKPWWYLSGQDSGFWLQPTYSTSEKKH